MFLCRLIQGAKLLFVECPKDSLPSVLVLDVQKCFRNFCSYFQGKPGEMWQWIQTQLSWNMQGSIFKCTSLKASYIFSIQRQYLFESESSLALPTIMKGPLWTNCHIAVWFCLKQCILDWLSVILRLSNRISIGLFQWKIITFKVLLKENSKSKWGHPKWNFEIIISIKKAMVVMCLLYC